MKSLIYHWIRVTSITLYAQEVWRNLVSVLILLKLGICIVFTSGCMKVFLDNVCYGSGYMLNDFMVLVTINVFVNDNTSIYVVGNSSTSSDIDSVIWHVWLGHIRHDRLNKLAKACFLGSLVKVKLSICEHCHVEKTTRLPFGKAKRTTSQLQLIHSDIYGPMNVRTKHGAKYFITFIDDFIRFDHVYLISHKSESLDCFT